MAKDERDCDRCVRQLINQNQQLWADAVKRLGDDADSDWCNVCHQLYAGALGEKIDLYPHYDELEIEAPRSNNSTESPSN